jgi:uncharacterized protein YbjT (DUF2867 family)
MILVTGATGTAGSEVVKSLLERKVSFRVFVRDPRKVAHLPASVERAIGDLTQPGTLVPALQGVSRLFLLSDPDQVPPVLDAARRTGVRHVVRLSTLEAGASPLKLSLWHQQSEEAVKASGMAWTMIKPGNFASNALMWVDMVKAKGIVFHPTGSGKTSPIDPGDIGAAAAVALTGAGHEGKSYRLTGPELLSAGDQVRIIGEALGRPLTYVPVTPAQAGDGMRKGRAPEPLIEMLTELWEDIAKGNDGGLTDTVETLTGRKPRAFAAWAREHVGAFRS